MHNNIILGIGLAVIMALSPNLQNSGKSESGVEIRTKTTAVEKAPKDSFRYLAPLPTKPEVFKSKTQRAIKQPPSAPTVPLEQGRIAAYIYHVAPQKGKKYAHSTAKIIFEAARKFSICPYWVAATGKVESTFDMSDGPQYGIMQFTRSTGRGVSRKYGYDYRSMRGNINCGAAYLSECMRPRYVYPASRSGMRYNLSKMWSASAQYNDGPRGTRTRKGTRYAAKVLSVREAIMKGAWIKRKR